jgi:hypothetical protein
MVPVETVCTLTVVVTRGEALELVVANQIPTPAPTATTAAAEMTAGLLVNHFLRLGLTYASLAARSPAGSSPWATNLPTGLDEPDAGWPGHPIHQRLTPGHSHLWGF